MPEDRSVDPEQVRQRIAEWLRDGGLDVRAAEDPEALWSLEATGGDLSVVVTVATNRPKVVRLRAEYSPSFRERAALEELTSTEREAFLWEVRFRLLGFGVYFSGVEGLLETVSFLEELHWGDEVQANLFMDRVRRTLQARAIVVFCLLRLTGEESQPGASSLPVN
jgi:hypothetical protein